MDLRLTFNEVPALYDRLRPTYLPALFEDIFAYAGIGPGSRVLEIGIGTGQATPPFLTAGCRVTAVELGDALADFTRRKFAAYPNFDVVNAAFEDYAGEDGTFDLIYSASAFHWIPQEVGYPKVFRLLKSGGTFARFSNNPYKDKGNEPLHQAMQAAYARHIPEIAIEKAEFDEQMNAQRAALAGQYGFVDLAHRMYKRIRPVATGDYVTLIGTFSDHRAAGKERLAALQREVGRAVDAYGGGTINLYDTQNLQLARKP